MGESDPVHLDPEAARQAGHAAIVAGDEIATEAALEESSERGGLRFYVFKTTSTNQRGELVSEGRWTNIVR